MAEIKTITSTTQIDGVISKDFNAECGKHNVVSSINLWLTDIVRGGQLDGTSLTPEHDFYWAFNSQIAPLQMPCIAVQEIGLFDIGKRAFDGNLVGFTEDGKPIRAVQNQTLIEINCWATDSDNFGGATKKVYNLRDRVVYALEFAGTMTDKDDAFIIPPIKLRDFSKVDKPVIGVIRLDPNGNAINEKFLIDPVTNQLKNYKLLVRFLYDECKNPL